MGSKREKQRVWPIVGVLAISALLHVALLFLPLPGLRHETRTSEPSSLRVELVAREPIAEPRKDMPTPAPPPEPVVENIPEPDRSAPAEAASLEETSSIEPQPEVATQSPAPTTEPASEAIRTQLLDAARDLGRKSEQPKEGRGLAYHDVPALPSQPGWLHQHTGRVTPSIDRWRGNDGSQSARIVTGSGHVVCVRTRAPTIAETFNPWMSSAVPMASLCGRERPEALNQENPWVRRPGADGE